MSTKKLYGLMAEFTNTEDLIRAAEATRLAGYKEFDAYTPHPVEGLTDAMGPKKVWLPLLVLLGGLAGGIGGFCLQYWISVIEYPLNVGGRPYNSWPAFIPVTFEMTILGAALTAVIGMILMNGLPMPYHPVFNVAAFELASTDHFFLCIEAKDKKFDLSATREFMNQFSGAKIHEVEA